MKNKYKISLYAILLLTFFDVSAQHKEVGIVKKLTFYNYAIISIDFSSETYRRLEVATIYAYRSHIMMHLVLKSMQTTTDTTVTLSGKQIMEFEKFEENLRKNKLEQDNLIIAGSYALYSVWMDGVEEKYSNKINFSMLNSIIKAK
jgi:hypothetical protein